ncbi:MAG: D-mannonate epimerase [Defluviitaleaceae bacterium]|nr:D-mannonate epimerase [Defluviitaleaceae bacterium]
MKPKILLVPPDGSRPYSYGGVLTNLYYHQFTRAGKHVDILPALGTHAPMDSAELSAFFGEGIPPERFLVHDWRNGVEKIGEIPAEYVREVISDGIGGNMDSGGGNGVGTDSVFGETVRALFSQNIPVEISKYLTDPSYESILSIGQVVPHEVAGMANYTKNIVVGCGGSGFINASHMVGAAYGIERTQGKTNTPVRKLFDYAEERFLSRLPIVYALTVVESETLCGLFVGRGRAIFEKAAALSAERNITYVAEPIKNCVVNLGEGVRSTWLGNKAIYRTRMAIADGGSLLVLAPGVNRFGEDDENDRLIRKYGYSGRERVLSLCATEKDLQENLSVAAHLIHGSTDGRFTVTYAAPRLGREAVEAVGYRYMEWEEAVKLKDADGAYYIENPATGLWSLSGS